MSSLLIILALALLALLGWAAKAIFSKYYYRYEMNALIKRHQEREAKEDSHK